MAARGRRSTHCSKTTPSGNSTSAMLIRARRVSSTRRSPRMVHCVRALVTDSDDTEPGDDVPSPAFERSSVDGVPGTSAVAAGRVRLVPEVGGGPAGRVRAERHDPARVQLVVGAVVVPLDVVEVDRVAESRRLEQVPGVRPEHRHLGDLVPVHLKWLWYTASNRTSVV